MSPFRPAFASRSQRIAHLDHVAFDSRCPFCVAERAAMFERRERSTRWTATLTANVSLASAASAG